MIAPQDSGSASTAENFSTAAQTFGLAPTADYDRLVDELRQLIVKVANLPHVQPESIDPEQPLYRDGLGLDSIDVLELVVNVERNYSFKIRNDDQGRLALRNLGSLAAALHRHLNEPSAPGSAGQAPEKA